MDSFDDFEMKPLTEGLGFHKKAARLKNESRNLGANAMGEIKITKPLLRHSGDLKMNGPQYDPFENPEMPPPLPKREPKKAPIAQVNFEIPKTKISMDTGIRRSGHSSPTQKLTPLSASVPSALLDGVLVLAFSILFLISLVVVTDVNLGSVLGNLFRDVSTQISLAILYVSVLLMYVVVARSFFGRTLGEWTFDLQMGDHEQITQANYPILVLWRSIFIVITGVVVMPLLSLALGRDLASVVTGVQLYRRN